MDSEPVMKAGTFLYDNQRIAKVRIVETDIRPGTGDYEDPPELQNDKRGVFYEVQYTAAGEARFCNGGGWFESLEAAVSYCEAKMDGIEWASQPNQRMEADAATPSDGDGRESE